MARVRVTSEIGPLRAVLVHTPGPELLAVTPGNRADYLYDDIIDLDLAEREHRRFVAVLERFAQVYEVRALLTELVARIDVREFLVTRALEVVPSDALAKQLAELPADQLVGVMVEGALEEAGPIARALNETRFALPPLPNLFFTRDVGIVIGEHSIIGSMRYGVRWTEELLIKALFRYHPCLENAGILYDGSEEKRTNYTLEGREEDPQLLRGAAGGGPAARAGVLQRQRTRPAGAGAVVVGVQLLRRAARCGGHLRAQRGHAAGARARRIQDRARSRPARGWGEGAGRRRAGRRHDRGERAGAGRRRPPLHDAAVEARRPLIGVAAYPSSSLANRAVAYLEAGPAPSGPLGRDVLGPARTPRGAAVRLATTPLCPDPPLTRTADGRSA